MPSSRGQHGDEPHDTDPPDDEPGGTQRSGTQPGNPSPSSNEPHHAFMAGADPNSTGDHDAVAGGVEPRNAAASDAGTHDTGATAVIELSDADREGARPAKRAGGRSRPIPRRHLVLGAVALLAVGFVAGLLAQRANTPEPSDDHAAPAGSATRVAIPAVAFDVPYVQPNGCRNFARGYHEAGVTTVCTGSLRSIQHHSDDWRLVIAAKHRKPQTIMAHDDSKVFPSGSLPTLKVGSMLRVSGHLVDDDDALHAVAIAHR